MGNIIVQDIVWHIGQHLRMDQIFRLSRIDRYINIHVKEILWTHDIVDLRWFDHQTLLDVFRTYKFTQVDLSNTMISDSFGADMSMITNLIAKNCFNITDDFIGKIPRCKKIDLTNCMNIIGSFLEHKPTWTELKLSGCYFLELKYFVNLKECHLLNLCHTILYQRSRDAGKSEIESFVSVLERCGKVLLDFYRTNEPNNVVHIGYKFEPVVPPSIIHICHYYKSNTTIRTAKMLSRLYIRYRYDTYVKSILKFSDKVYMDVLQEYFIITQEFIEVISSAQETNILHNLLFFRNKYDMHQIMNDKDLIMLDNHYYDNNLLNDMIRNNYFPIVTHKKIKYISHTEYSHQIDSKTTSLREADFDDIKSGPFPLTSQHGYHMTDPVRVSKIPLQKFNSYLDTYKKIRDRDQENINLNLKKIGWVNKQLRDTPLSKKEAKDRIKERINDPLISPYMPYMPGIPIQLPLSRHISPLSRKEIRHVLRDHIKKRNEFDAKLREGLVQL